MNNAQLSLAAYTKLIRAVNSLNKALEKSPGWIGGLTLSQFGVLEALYHKEELTSQELSRKILKSKGNMTLVIDNLEKKGLIQRRRCVDDRRKVYVRLTDAGRECIAEVFPQHAEAIVHHMSVLNPQELEELGRICRKLGLTLEEAL